MCITTNACAYNIFSLLIWFLCTCGQAYSSACTKFVFQNVPFLNGHGKGTTKSSIFSPKCKLYSPRTQTATSCKFKGGKSMFDTGRIFGKAMRIFNGRPVSTLGDDSRQKRPLGRLRWRYTFNKTLKFLYGATTGSYCGLWNSSCEICQFSVLDPIYRKNEARWSEIFQFSVSDLIWRKK